MSEFYDQPIMSNLARPHYVERMIALGLGRDWKLVSANWSGWDIENTTGVRIEVKQSAARQVWTDRPSSQGRPSKGIFDIAPRTGYWAEDGSQWIDVPGRPADIYIFAWHPIERKSKADHRDASQWEFYVVHESELPEQQKTIGVTRIANIASPVSYIELAGCASKLVSKLPETKRSRERYL